MSSVHKKLLSRLPDNLNKSPNSNISKLMQLVAHHSQEKRDLLNRIDEWRDIDKAEGETLDRIGRNVQQPRGQASDEVYRIMIKARIIRNLSNGSINTIIEYLSLLLQIDKQQVQVKELWQEGRDATINVTVPVDAITKTGLTLSQFGQLIGLITANGVGTETFFQGSFEFASGAESEFDNTKGFADDARTIGGTLGYMYDPAQEADIPW